MSTAQPKRTYGTFVAGEAYQRLMTLKGQKGTGVRVQAQPYTFQWDPRYQADIHPGLVLKLEVLQALGKYRQIRPCGGIGVYRHTAYAYGFAMRCERDKTSESERRQLRLMYMIWRRFFSTQSHINRRFKGPKDLQVVTSGPRSNFNSILPEAISWDPRTLIEQGRLLAGAWGFKDQNAEFLIGCGLMAHALNEQTVFSNNEIQGLIRRALFDTEDYESVSEDILSDVFERVTKLIGRHQNDGQEKFERWYRGGNSNFVKAVENFKGRTRLDRKVVIAALNELAWRNYQEVGECIDLCGEVVTSLLPADFSVQEQRIFDQMYRRQPYFGGLPYPLLSERNELLAPVYLAIERCPDDPTLVPALHRMLGYYEDMASRRRSEDRERKQAKNRPHTQSLENSLDLPANEVESKVDVTDLPQLEDLAKRLGLPCDPSKCLLNLEIKFESGDAFVLLGTCHNHGKLPPIHSTIEKAKEKLKD